MRKILIFLTIIVLMLASLSAYVILTEKIISGNLKVAEGEKKLAEGEKMLAQGKAKLARGKRDLSKAQNADTGIKALPLLNVVALPISIGVMLEAKNKISAGSRQLARGNERIKEGEKQLAAGKLELRHGIELLNWVNKIRIACAAASVFFACLLLWLGFYWRQALAQLVRKGVKS